MQRKVNYVAIGIFVLVLGTSWILFSIWLIFGDVRYDYRDYYVYMTESVSGLLRDSAVRYRGVNVGKVARIELAPDNPQLVRLTLEIREGTPIKTDTTATLAAQGLTGIYFVELSGGSRETDLLEAAPGEQVPVIEYTPSLYVRVEEAFSRLSEELQTLTVNVNRFVTDENAESVNAILADLAEFSDALAASAGSLAPGVDHARMTFEHLDQVTGRFAARSAELDQALAELPQVVSGMNAAIGELRALTARVDTTAGATLGDTAAELNVLMAEMRTTLGELDGLLRQIQEQPNMLISGRRERPPGPGE